MAKTKGTKYFTKYECDYMRHGVMLGKTYAQIARDLGRKRQGVSHKIKEMEADGTIGQLNLPCFEVTEQSLTNKS